MFFSAGSNKNTTSISFSRCSRGGNRPWSHLWQDAEVALDRTRPALSSSRISDSNSWGSTRQSFHSTHQPRLIFTTCFSQGWLGVKSSYTRIFLNHFQYRDIKELFDLVGTLLHERSIVHVVFCWSHQMKFNPSLQSNAAGVFSWRFPPDPRALGVGAPKKGGESIIWTNGEIHPRSIASRCLFISVMHNEGQQLSGAHSARLQLKPHVSESSRRFHRDFEH